MLQFSSCHHTAFNFATSSKWLKCYLQQDTLSRMGKLWGAYQRHVRIFHWTPIYKHHETYEKKKKKKKRVEFIVRSSHGSLSAVTNIMYIFIMYICFDMWQMYNVILTNANEINNQCKYGTNFCIMKIVIINVKQAKWGCGSFIWIITSITKYILRNKYKNFLLTFISVTEPICIHSHERGQLRWSHHWRKAVKA